MIPLAQNRYHRDQFKTKDDFFPSTQKLYYKIQWFFNTEQIIQVESKREQNTNSSRLSPLPMTHLSPYYNTLSKIQIL